MQYDLLIIGGGISGAGILLEASKRGLKCLLVEQQDFAWGTSSRSSKMVHGGLRYLASGQIKLTRQAVTERRLLLREAPGLVSNLNFFMPHYQGEFPGPKLFDKVMMLYDALAGKQNHEFYSAQHCSLWVSGLQQQKLLGATRFADALVDDARLVMRVLNEAKTFGAECWNYHRASQIHKNAQGQVIGAQIHNLQQDSYSNISAKAVINATGAWTDQLRTQLGAQAVIRPLRGSHLLLPFWRLPVACAVSFFHPTDQRPVFIFPWEGLTLIGTTDLDHIDDLNIEAGISQMEIDYLLQAANHLFPQAQLTNNDIQASLSGVRPVLAGSKRNPSKEKRKHAIWDDNGLISVAGGKLTTFRRIALDVLAKAQPYLSATKRTAPTQLFAVTHLPRPSQLNAWQWQRLTGRYGAQASELLALPLQPIGNSSTLWAELLWSAQHEQIIHLDDLLLRRTRLGLLLPQGGAEFAAELQQQLQPILHWNQQQWQQEWQRYQHIWQQHYSPTPHTDNLQKRVSA